MRVAESTVTSVLNKKINFPRLIHARDVIPVSGFRKTGIICMRAADSG